MISKSTVISSGLVFCLPICKTVSRARAPDGVKELEALLQASKQNHQNRLLFLRPVTYAYILLDYMICDDILGPVSGLSLELSRCIDDALPW